MDEMMSPAHPERMVYRLGSTMLVVALGCGPVLGDLPGDDGEASDDGGASTTGSIPTTGASGHQDATGSGDTGAGVDDDGDATGDDPVPGLCGAPDGAQPLAVLSTQTTAAVLRADASSVELDVKAGAVPPEASSTLSIDAHGAYVAVSLSWTLVQDGVHHGSEVSLFDEDGSRLWHVSEPGASVSGVRVGAGGSVVATRVLDGGPYEGVLYDAGVPVALPSFQPHGRLRDDGLVPGRHVDDGPGTPGWQRTDDLSFVALTFGPLDNWFRVDEAGDYLYVTRDEPVASIVRESPDGPEVTALSGAELPPTFHVAYTSSSDWLLLHGEDGEPWFRVSVAEGLVELLDLAPPAGFQWLECYVLTPVIDELGRVLLPTRDELAGRVQRLDPDTGAWEPVAAPVTRIDTMSAQVYGQTTVVRSEGENTTFCPPLSFESAPGVLEGSLWQLQRDGVERVLPADTAWLGLDAEGTCAAIIAPKSDQTTLLDLADGSEYDLPGSYGVSWWHHP